MKDASRLCRDALVTTYEHALFNLNGNNILDILKGSNIQRWA